MSLSEPRETALEHFTAWRQRLETYDRPLLLVGCVLLAIGVLLSMAASPAQTARIDVEQAFYFAMRQAAYACAGAIAVLLVATMDARALRRFGVVLACVAAPLCVVAAFTGDEVKGAARWLYLGPLSLQPSELLKPGLVLVWAWMLSEQMRHPRFPGRLVALGVFAVAVGALVLQPDIGQIALLTLVLLAMLMMSGLAWTWIFAGLGLIGAAGFAFYHAFPHVRARVDAYLNPDGEHGLQVGASLNAFASGGLFGRGPGEGVVKRSLPDAHADFVYAVGAEEFGLFASIGIVAVFAVLVFRGLSRSARLNDPFEQLAAGGLVCLLALQAAIHIAVNMSLIPAKGMTLPFVSFGGSSMLGTAIAFGACLSFLRNRPGAFLFGRAP